MEEDHGLAVGARARFALPQHPRALGDEAVACRDDVAHLVAKMVDAARRILGEEACDGRSFAKRMQEFQLGVGQRDEDRRDSMLRQVERLARLRRPASRDRARSPLARSGTAMATWFKRPIMARLLLILARERSVRRLPGACRGFRAAHAG